MKKYKKLSDPYHLGLFQNYSLTELMLLKKKNKAIKTNQNTALYIMLEEKLEEYGLLLFASFERNNLTFRGIIIANGFPIENEPIFKQLYGYKGFVANINIKGFDDYSLSFDYHTDTGVCQLQKCRLGSLVNSLDFDSFAAMMKYIKAFGYDII